MPNRDLRRSRTLAGMFALSLVVLLLALPARGEAAAAASRHRRSDDYDNLDNFLMGSNDYDNFFLKTAKSVPRIGRRSRADDLQGPPVHLDRRSTDMNELVPSYAGGDHFFLKASKSVPRIGKRNDEFFMKTAKSVPRIGRRSGDGPDNFLLKGKEHSDYLKTSDPRPRRTDDLVTDALKPAPHRVERRSHLQVEEREPGHRHRIQRRNYDELMAKAAKTMPRMGKRMHPSLDEVGDWSTEQQWPWFRQHDSSPGPYKRANPADSIDLADFILDPELINKSPLQHFMWSVITLPKSRDYDGDDKGVPWNSLDQLLRRLEGGSVDQADDRGHDVVLLDGEDDEDAEKWTYSAAGAAGDKKEANKELEEGRFQPDVKRK